MGKKIKNGFTIIEVSLVLAIAGLIFLAVFVALPAIQRQARNTEREEDITNLVAAIKKYQTNNRGALPGATDTNNEITVNNDENADKSANANSWRGFLRDYMDNKFKDPNSGERYNLKVVSCESQTDKACENLDSLLNNDFENNNYTIYVVKQSKCAGDESVGAVGSSNPRKVSVLYKLEGFGLYCSNT